MPRTQKALCSLLSLTLTAAPFGAANAQAVDGPAQPASPSFTHTACIDYGALAVGTGIYYRFPSDTEWREADHSSRRLLLAANEAKTVRLAFWKDVPRRDVDRTRENLVHTRVDLALAADSRQCASAGSTYHLRHGGAEGFGLCTGLPQDTTSAHGGGSTTSGTRREGPSPGAIALGVLGALALFAIINSGSSRSGPSGSSSGGSSPDRSEELTSLRLQEQERARREAAARADQAREAALHAQRSRELDASYRRLQQPNALGW